MFDFDKYKNDILNKKDKSHIKKIDEKIKSLCEQINKHKNLVTLSSCSGRICILNKTAPKKEKNCWEFVSHNLVTKEEIINSLNNLTPKKWCEIRQEGSILHISTRDLKTAQKLLHIAKISGFNQVGIISSKNKTIVELICDLTLIVPFKDKKTILNMIDCFIERANKNLLINWKNIKKLEKNIKEL